MAYCLPLLMAGGGGLLIRSLAICMHGLWWGSPLQPAAAAMFRVRAFERMGLGIIGLFRVGAAALRCRYPWP